MRQTLWLFSGGNGTEEHRRYNRHSRAIGHSGIAVPATVVLTRPAWITFKPAGGSTQRIDPLAVPDKNLGEVLGRVFHDLLFQPFL